MNTLIRIIMTKKENFPIDEGSREAPEQFYIKITADGPYFVYGNPPLTRDYITECRRFFLGVSERETF